MSPPRFVERIAPGRTILISLLCAIVLGALLLALPIAHYDYIPFIDLLFTATSATCVTGLLTIPFNAFTPFGHFILLCLIQIGGLGLITMTIFVISIFMQVGYGTQILAGQLLELESWKNIKSLLFFIIKVTAIVECLGALATYACIGSYGTVKKTLFVSFFHAVSSFCNAGFTLFTPGIAAFQSNLPMLFTTMLLMFSGGIGFIVILELLNYIRSYFFQRKRAHLSLSTKIVLSITTFLWITATLIYWTLERDNVFTMLSPITAAINAAFMGVSTKSTGFLTMQPNQLHVATLFFMLLLSFIGSSPGSTGSGIKTTTFAIFLATIAAAISTRTSVEIKGRRIARDQVYKALAIISLASMWIIIMTFFMLITERGLEFFEVFFEVVSAFATLGISTGITPYLTTFGKCFIMLTMIIGRIGPLTVVIALRRRKELHEYEYPEERVMLG